MLGTMRSIEGWEMTHPVVMRKMRQYAIRQALSEIGSDPKPEEMAEIARRHMLGYSELKQAYGRETQGRERAKVRT